MQHFNWVNYILISLGCLQERSTKNAYFKITACFNFKFIDFWWVIRHSHHELITSCHTVMWWFRTPMEPMVIYLHIQWFKNGFKSKLSKGVSSELGTQLCGLHCWSLFIVLYLYPMMAKTTFNSLSKELKRWNLDFWTLRPLYAVLMNFIRIRSWFINQSVTNQIKCLMLNMIQTCK